MKRRDLFFLIDTLIPTSADKEATAEKFQDDDDLVEAMLDDDRLFRRLMADEAVLVHVSPWLFFTVLLRRARRDLEQEAFTIERRDRQKVVLFDTHRVIELLEREPVRDYLATMLASFTRVDSVTVPVRVRKGVWRRYRTSDMDVDGLMRYSQTLDKEFQFEPYKRIGDVCLFLTSMFPAHIDAQYRYPVSRQVRPRSRSRLVQSRDDYEAHGQVFYRMASQHERARLENLDEVLATLSKDFILAEKPLAFLASRYLGFAQQRLFDI